MPRYWPLLLPLALAACAAPQRAATVPAQFTADSVATGTTARLIGLDAAPGGVVWAAGAGGAWIRSLDGGRSWTAGTVPGADTLQFRDVHAFDARRAVLLAIGPGSASRLYATDDGGTTWTLRWANADPRAFYDCMAFDGETGFAFSDAVPLDDSTWHLPMVETTDGGRSWRPVPEEQRLNVREGTGAFASSGTCAVSVDGRWLVAVNRTAGAAPSAEVLVKASDQPWRVMTMPFTPPDPMRGVATLAVQGDALFAGLLGAVDGRTLYRADRARALAGIGLTIRDGSSDRGVRRDTVPTWQPMPPLPIGRVYGLAAGRRALVATGPDGLAASADGGQTWRLLARADLWSVVRVDDATFVAVGRGGQALRITLR